MSGLEGPWGLSIVIVAAAAVSDVWRVLGAVVASRIDETSAAYRLVKAVATALIAAIIGRLALYPTGAMADVPAWLRVGSMAVGFAAYFATKRSMVVGTIVCEALLAGGVFRVG